MDEPLRPDLTETERHDLRLLSDLTLRHGSRRVLEALAMMQTVFADPGRSGGRGRIVSGRRGGPERRSGAVSAPGLRSAARALIARSDMGRA